MWAMLYLLLVIFIMYNYVICICKYFSNTSQICLFVIFNSNTKKSVFKFNPDLDTRQLPEMGISIIQLCIVECLCIYIYIYILYIYIYILYIQLTIVHCCIYFLYTYLHAFGVYGNTCYCYMVYCP